MWFAKDVIVEKSSLFGSKLHRQQQQQPTSSTHSRPLSQSKSFNNIEELSSYQNYVRFEIKCGNASFVYEKNINRGKRAVSH